jgi:selenocysteine-specific elongation factor
MQVPCPDDLKGRLAAETLQFTLVDCPGHASLLKTVLVGAQIIDMMLLVVDATKGIQAQTAECIIVGELLSQCAVIALNKVDLFPADCRQKESRRSGRRVMEALQLTRFATAEIVPVAAKSARTATGATPADTACSTTPSNHLEASTGKDEIAEPAELHSVAEKPSLADTGARDTHAAQACEGTIGINDLKNALLKNVPQLKRNSKLPFLFMADHCFQIKGHGTVLSGEGSTSLQMSKHIGYISTGA